MSARCLYWTGHIYLAFCLNSLSMSALATAAGAAWVEGEEWANAYSLIAFLLWIYIFFVSSLIRVSEDKDTKIMKKVKKKIFTEAW